MKCDNCHTDKTKYSVLKNKNLIRKVLALLHVNSLQVQWLLGLALRRNSAPCPQSGFASSASSSEETAMMFLNIMYILVFAMKKHTVFCKTELNFKYYLDELLVSKA
jgi:hypothetical protein